MSTTVIYKIVTALTGLSLVAFLIGHLGGNLLFFLGADSINAYAEKLKSMPILLWAARIGLIALISTHIGLTIWLRKKSTDASGRYQMRQYQRTTRASRWMMVSGVLILTFIFFHLAHFTMQWIFVASPDAVDADGRHDVHGMIADSFQNPIVVAVYLVGMFVVMLHLKHALFSVVQTLGIGVGRRDRFVRKAASVLATLLAVGFLSIPLFVFFGIVGETP